jgi:hypothetical protein
MGWMNLDDFGQRGVGGGPKNAKILVGKFCNSLVVVVNLWSINCSIITTSKILVMNSLATIITSKLC